MYTYIYFRESESERNNLAVQLAIFLAYTCCYYLKYEDRLLQTSNKQHSKCKFRDKKKVCLLELLGDPSRF